MKKTALVLIIATLFAFKAGDNKMTMTLSLDEWGIIYNALGKLPAENVEGLRAKIANEYSKTIDTTKK